MNPALWSKALAASLLAGLMLVAVNTGAQTGADEKRAESRDSRRDDLIYRVVDSEGRSVKGAIFRIFPGRTAADLTGCREEPTDPQMVSRTTSKGMIDLSNQINPSTKNLWGVEIWVNHIGFPFDLFPDQSLSRIIRLPRLIMEQVASTGRITGTVVEDHRTPLTGVCVGLVPYEARALSNSLCYADREYTGKTDAGSSFAFDLPKAGDYLLRIEDGHVDARAKFPIFIPASSDLKVKIHLCPRGSGYQGRAYEGSISPSRWSATTAPTWWISTPAPAKEPKCESSAEFLQPETALRKITGTIFDRSGQGLSEAIIRVSIASGSKGVMADKQGKFAINHLYGNSDSCNRISVNKEGYAWRVFDIQAKAGHDMVFSTNLDPESAGDQQ